MVYKLYRALIFNQFYIKLYSNIIILEIKEQLILQYGKLKEIYQFQLSSLLINSYYLL